MELYKDKINRLLAGIAVLKCVKDSVNNEAKDLIFKELSLSLEVRDILYLYKEDNEWIVSRLYKRIYIGKYFDYVVYSMEDLIKNPAPEYVTETLDIASMRISGESPKDDNTFFSPAVKAAMKKKFGDKENSVCLDQTLINIHDPRITPEEIAEIKKRGESLPKDTIFTMDKDGTLSPSPESVGLKPIPLNTSVYRIPPDPDAPASKHELIEEPVPTPKKEFAPEVGVKYRFYNEDPTDYEDVFYYGVLPCGYIATPEMPPSDFLENPQDLPNMTIFKNMSPIPEKEEPEPQTELETGRNLFLALRDNCNITALETEMQFIVRAVQEDNACFLEAMARKEGEKE